MSTRALYSFEHDVLPHPIFYYIHYDGCPKGAAIYFEHMRQKSIERVIGGLDSLYDGYRGGFAELFIKANPKYVEFCEPYEDGESDCEYHYAFTLSGQLTARRIKSWSDESPVGVFFKGHFGEFIKQYGPVGNIVDGKPFPRLYRVGHRLSSDTGVTSEPDYMTREELERWIVELSSEGSSSSALSQARERMAQTRRFHEH